MSQKKNLSARILAFCMVLLLAEICAAQISTANLSIHTEAGEKVPLPGVSVVVANTETGLVRTSVTDPRGSAYITSPPENETRRSSSTGRRSRSIRPLKTRGRCWSG